tara:strand:- start:200 stop:421 length:222 start_codon:yes stop_codon:yes gene_type:complete
MKYIKLVLNLKIDRNNNMEFNFDKFVKDIENRKKASINNKQCPDIDIEFDKARRLRSERYHEKWQNLIKWERK